MIKTIMNDDETIEVNYYAKDASFDHEFGTRKLKDYVVNSVNIYCEQIGEFITVTDWASARFDNLLIDLIEGEENGT